MLLEFVFQNLPLSNLGGSVPEGGRREGDAFKISLKRLSFLGVGRDGIERPCAQRRRWLKLCFLPLSHVDGNRE